MVEHMTDRELAVQRLEAAAYVAVQKGLTADEVRQVVEGAIVEATASTQKVAAAKESAATILEQYRNRRQAA